jgi:hypothetical protein
LPRSEVLIIGGPKQALFCIKNKIYFWSNSFVWRTLALGCISTAHDNSLNKLSSYLSNFLRQYPSAVLILENDSLPMQRLHILAAHDAGLKTICIQHGLFQASASDFIVDGNFADYMLVFDKHTKNLIAKCGICENKLHVLGYHSNPQSLNRDLRVGIKRKVCIIGQPWEKYSVTTFRTYIEIIQKLSRKMQGLGIEFIYKPHPWECKSKYLKELTNVVTCTLPYALANYDVFISMTSTVLYEANISGHIAIQILDHNFNGDNFESLGYAYTIESDKLSDIFTIITEAKPLYDPIKLASVSERFKNLLLLEIQ